MKLSEVTLAKVVGLYSEGYRYLKEAEIDYPTIKGKFQLGKTEYCETLQHVTDVEAQLCLNQMAYAFLGQSIIEGRWYEQWPDLKDLNFDDFLKLRKEHMFIKESHKYFRRETNPREPFYGHMTLERVRKLFGLYVAILNFSLNDNAAKGSLIAILKRV